jgi:hypothetical protein
MTYWALGGEGLGVLGRGQSTVNLLRHVQCVYPPEQVVLGPVNGCDALGFSTQHLCEIRIFGGPHRWPLLVNGQATLVRRGYRNYPMTGWLDEACC